MEKVLAVAVGGGIGSMLRYGVTVAANLHGGISFPYGTILVNTIGSFLIGMLMMYFESQTQLSPAVKLFIITGIIGGFTTFSTFNMEFLTLIRGNAMSLGVLYGGLNIVGGFICCWIGIVLGELLF
ncbi:chromosome condensation protein CrcB [Megasphaera cerevisiae DSM 20462]|uniref:Fluoride-specific ion channel FluC n=1 Tax=Megasphaera cerevisiae DSM 20462 TaxID=1122219 RepID=A0A0J6ZL96_9FIRM|nr:fluoride efflux transporter CrcB [Megasphaera cerevisiae]KMO85616.1 chromosome condensation protein CrcB [Megasphaera cerevisiae DSM 20462]OKY52273.1 chromosome condensation protein CrcB [Megasphaera cerevisiae]SKA12840.1 camphor resistance protein CrcB [Megasphaera cerevisiae DSM 20462]